MPLTDLAAWRPAATPARHMLAGHFVRLETLDPLRHGEDLWRALQGPDADPQLWDYHVRRPVCAAQRL